MNPYFAYSISFAVAISVYSLRWSNIYPHLSGTLLGFLFITIIGFVFAGFYWSRKRLCTTLVLSTDYNPVRITIFIYILWMADFLYEGGIPIYKILMGVPYQYELFGIPSLHVFIVTFSSFYTIYLFHLYLSTKKKLILFLYLLNLTAALLIFSRAMFIFNFSASSFLYLHFNSNFSRKLLLISPFVLVVLLFSFGVIGNLRVSHNNNNNYDNTIFLSTGKATDNFKNSVVPNEFFWTYIYASSSIANLQENINKADRHSISLSWFLKMINNEMLPDFISKRINRWFQIPHPGEYRIERYFNVSTVYSIAFSHQSWPGMIIMSIYLLLIPLVYIRLFPGNSPFTTTGIAIMTTMYLFMAYDNTIRFTGLSFQLFYPLFFGWLETKNIFSLRKIKSN